MPKKSAVTIKERIDLTVQKAEEVAEAWLKENESKIEIKVRQMLDQRLQEIVAKIMGFNQTWSDRWEVDHCNGRVGESLVGDWIRSQAKEAALKWMGEQMGNLPPLPPAAIKSAKKEYLEILEYDINEHLKDVALKNVSKAIEQVLGKEFINDDF